MEKMTRGRKPKCFGNFTASDEINRIYGVKREDVDVGWEDSGWYCLTLCKHSFDCMMKVSGEQKKEREKFGGEVKG